MADNSTPLMVSYPRSGSAWLNAMIELYLDKPRGPLQNGGITWRPKKENESFFWIHTHDKALTQKPSKSKHGDIFLFRNPVDCIYSYCKADEKIVIEKEAENYKKLFEKWINSCKTVLIYEHTVKDPETCLRLVSKHFGIRFDKKKAQHAIQTCIKEKIMSNSSSKFHNSMVLQEQYKIERSEFSKANKEKILNIVMTDITSRWLSKII